MHKILIIEDDSVIANAIAKHIKTWGCEVKLVTDFQNVLSEFVEYAPHLTI